MIIITGTAGSIGSNLVTGLNQAGYKDLVLVDDFSRAEREKNYKGKAYTTLLDRGEFLQWIGKIINKSRL